MKYYFGKIKRKIAFLLIFLMSINSFAAIVSDNDGSAFVTKAEFDALKSSFNKQIDDYNDSIDYKIDGAIASYLSGIQLSTTEAIKSVYHKDYSYIESFGTDNKLPVDELVGSFVWDCLDYVMQFNTKWNAATSCGWIKCIWVPQAKRYGNYNVAKYDGAKYWNPTTYQRALAGDYIMKEVVRSGSGRFFDTEVGAQLLPFPYHDSNCPTDADKDNYVNFMTNASKAENNRGIGYLVTDTGYGTRVQEYYINKNTYALTTNQQISDKHGDYLSSNQFTVFTAYDTNVPAHSYNKGCTPTSSSNQLKWEDKAGDSKTLTSFFVSEYKVPFVVFPDNPNEHDWIKSYNVNSITKSDLNTRYVIEYNKGLYRQAATYSTTNRVWFEWPDGQSTADPTPDKWVTQVYKYSGKWGVFFVPEDLGYAGMIFDASKDRRNQFYYDKTVLADDDATLDNLLKANPLTKGVPLFKSTRDGKISFQIPFITNDEYDCWFTKGPIEGSTNVRTTKPTNIYTIAGQNANGSITIKNTTNVTFDVKKNDYIFCTWALKNKNGGGKIKLPIEGMLIYE